MRSLPLLYCLLLSPLTAASANAVPPMATVGAAQAARAGDASIHWQYALSDVVVTETGIDGQPTRSLSLPVVDSFLQTIAVYANSYPPHFDNAAEKADATEKLRHLVEVLVALDPGAAVNVEVLRREAFAYNLACNLDMAGACERTLQDYPRLLQMTPDEPAANYLYGAFLATLTPKQKEAIPYLEKSIKLGVAKANYTLGVLYLKLRDQRRALAYLQSYSTAFPDDLQAKQLIKAIQDSQIQSGATRPAPPG